jgi:TfoX/Sxy family transcriptional regulator of competence genes
MAYDEQLAARVRDALVGREAIVERKMFGGLGFLYHGNMCTGVRGNALIARLGDRADEALAEPHVRPFSSDDGRPAMTGWVLVDPPGIESTEDLEAWVDRAVAYTGSLPPK